MKRTKRKKNLKLRRSIRKTVASLIMVMAIVVAAIPVENYGTMKAADSATMTVRAQIETDYAQNYTNTASQTVTDRYDKAYYETNQTTGFPGDEILLQRIENGTITTMFKANKKSNAQTNTSAMITDYINPKIDADIEIKSSESYQYTVIKSDYLALIDNAFSGESYTVTFDKSTEKTYASANNLQAFDLQRITTNAVYSAQNYKSQAQNKFITYSNAANDFVNLKSTVESDYVRDLYNSIYFKTYLTDAQAAINNYNNKLADYRSRLDAIYTSQTPNQTDWDNLITEIKNELDKYDHVTKTYADFTSNKYDKLKHIQDYTICHRMTNDDQKDLVNYTLIECIANGDVDGDGTADSGAAVYVPQNSAGEYLAKGTVEIAGIASEAFSNEKTNKSNTITRIVIPNTVTFIGADAFIGQSRLATVVFNDNACKIIGDRAFKNCSGLTSFTFSSAASGSSAIGIIGNNAFEHTGTLSTSEKAFEIPASVEEIGVGCFNYSNIVNLSFAESQGKTITLDEYAFKDCTGLEKVTFPAKKQFIIKKGAFSCGDQYGLDVLSDFNYPTSMKELYQGSSEDDYDYCLAGRENLKNVVMPESLGRGANTEIPKNTFKGCVGLSTVTFSNNAGYAEFDTEIFKDVTNEEFIVIGPEYKPGTTDYAQPRQSAWDAKFTPNGEEKPVPYQYTNSKGTHLEIGDGDYIQSVDVKDATYAVLSKYDIKPGHNANSMIALEIPTKVGRYTIDEIAEGFLGKSVKDKIYKVVIGDGTVKKINAGAFEGCGELQWVELGDALTYIGSLAFGDCTKLENVVFSQTQTSTWGTDDSYWTELQIEDDAFKTGSQLLTFHGAINPNYRPYIIASNKNNTTQSDLTGSGNEICYKTDAPYNLTVIKDRSTQKMTLIDYPHYEEIDLVNEDIRNSMEEKFIANNMYTAATGTYSIVEKFESLAGLADSATTAKYANFSALENIEAQIISQTINMEIPEGIESVDAKTFFEAEKDNSTSIKYYFSQIYEENESNGTYTRKDMTRNLSKGKVTTADGVKALYTSVIKDADDEVVPGLFSGLFDEGDSTAVTDVIGNIKGLIGKTYDGHTFLENNDRGNDYITSINLETISSLPDYAFDSNENLLKVKFGTEMENVGALPFRACKSLYNIDTSGNTYYTFENMILYRGATAERTNLLLVESLEGRGLGGEYLGGIVSADTNPLLTSVTEIAEGAFSNNAEIKSVDLSKSKVRTIQKDTFAGCEDLTAISLPKTVSRIDDGALSGMGNYVVVEIPNPLCVISDKVLDSDDETTVLIKGIQYVNESTQETSPTYESYEQLKKAFPDKIDFAELGSTYTVEFVNGMDNMSTIKTYEVNKGADVEAPPTAPAITGYKFSNWICKVGDVIYTGEDAYHNITEDRVIVATYVSDPSTVVADGKTYTLTISGGTGYKIGGTSTPSSSLTISGGDTVTVIYTEVSGASFKTWSVTSTDGKDYSSLIASATSPTTTFTMPNANVTLTATNTNGTTGSGSDSDSEDANKTKYTVTVNYGSGSGEYAAGESVSISAYAPDSASKVFSKWTSTNTAVGFANASSSTTTFIMPASAVVVTANYKTRTADDEDDDDESTSSSNRRPTSSTTNVSTGTNNSANTSTITTGTVSQAGTSTTSDGDKLYITKNGVSNKDVGSAQVDGSTDNFVVKISESAEATAAVEEALRNKYGSLDGIAYFPMDISLYDYTGQNKIEDTYGLNVTVTMPIPDVLIQYGGNVRVAAADNGSLTELNVRFTTIDGIACMSFVPPHFSPYVIYVDTNNLVAGQTTDATPKTGDPIHPKWFLAFGMAGLSMLLFVTGDTRKRKIRVAQ